MKFHIENINKSLGLGNSYIVFYASVENCIKFFLPKLPSGQYLIHTLDPINIYAKPITSTPAYRKVSTN